MNPSHIIPNLSDEQKEIARRILQKHDFPTALELLAEPPPNGIGIQMSKATLSRLKRRLELEAQLAELGDARSQATAIAREKQLDELQTASLVLLKEKAFQLALSNDPLGLELSCRILRDLHRMEKSAAVPPTTAMPENSQVRTEEFRLEIARTVLLHFGEIGSVRGNPGLSEERKLQMIRERLFNKPKPPVV
jgi:hypothetical protein